MRTPMHVPGVLLVCMATAACQKADTPIASALAPVTAAKPDARPDYHPSMGDLMTMAVQPRHAKLAMAGKARNWAYASYEADELKNAFDRIARTIPDYRDNNVGKTVDTYMKMPIEAVKAAIKMKDAKAFDAAFTEVTAGCNSCHEALEHPMVRIRAPVGDGPFADQDFSAPAK